VVLKKESLFVGWLRLHDDIICSKEFSVIIELQNLTRVERQNLEKLQAELYVPIKAREGELSGLLTLGEKLSHQTYSDEDRRLLSTIARQIAVSLENASLYREVRRSEIALRESEEKLRLMFDSMTEGVVVSDLDANVIQVNEAALRMYGYDSKEGLIGRSAIELIAKKGRTKAIKNMKRLLEDGYVKNVEYTLLRKDGGEFDAELGVSVMRDTSGNPTGFVAITEDITERKRAQEREKQLQNELNLSSRLASIGELAAGVAHEINNPLTGILGFSHRLLRKCADEKVSRDLERIYGEAARAGKVVQKLLAFARHREPSKQYSDINDIVRETLELRNYELKTSNIEVHTELAAELPKIMVDFHQIQEVFLNIVLNAEQAMTEANHGGKLSIKTEKAKGYVRISFVDNGPGIPAEHLDKVFDPFFTLREERGGTGLGLSICHGIVTEHGGRIHAKSTPGKGATFIIELPMTTEDTDVSEVIHKETTLQSK
jgi:two-component system NtrC family sensor kinase